MKKYLTISALALFATTAVVSCTNNDRDVVEVPAKVDYPQVYDLNNINFTAANDFSYAQNFAKPMLPQDYVVIYRYKGNNSAGKPVWEPIPKTIYLNNNREVDYDYDFSVNGISIFLQGTFDVTTTPEFSLNQKFRVVLIPAEYGNKNQTDIRKLSYDEVIQRYNIDDTKPAKF